MKHVDMRKLAPAAQEERRRQVIGLRQSGVSYAAIAAQVGLSQTGVFDICQRFAAPGKKGLASGKRGRKPDEQRLLDATQERAIKRLICRHMPDELGLDFALWSREAVRALIRRQYGVRLAVRTTGKYLARWGFTAQKPLRRAYEQNPADVRHWLRHAYPAIVARARRARGVIFWGDETGLRADDVRGRSYAPPGKTPRLAIPPSYAWRNLWPALPVVRPNHRRIGLGLISAVSNKGEVRWKVLNGAIKAPVLICFLQRLIRDAGRKVFLILDRLPVHRSAVVRDWLTRHKAQIEVFHLPSYSPELNPDEGLNADLKQHITRKAPLRSKQALKQAAISHMHRLSKSPTRVRSFFHQKSMRYAA
jgi:transposase